MTIMPNRMMPRSKLERELIQQAAMHRMLYVMEHESWWLVDPYSVTVWTRMIRLSRQSRREAYECGRRIQGVENEDVAVIDAAEQLLSGIEDCGIGNWGALEDAVKARRDAIDKQSTSGQSVVVRYDGFPVPQVTGHQTDAKPDNGSSKEPCPKPRKGPVGAYTWQVQSISLPLSNTAMVARGYIVNK